MKEKLARIKTRDGTMETFVTHPEQGGPFPAIVVYMDVWGIREELFDIARRIATVGYYCMVPDLYYRWGRIRFEYRDDKGRMLSLTDLDEETQKKVMEPHLKLTNAMVIDDTKALIDLISAGEPAKPEAMGSIGYCMGGRHVLCAAGAFPENFKATASLHGTYMVSEAEDSPHHMFSRMQGELYCGFASLDRFTPPELRDEMARLLKDCKVKYNPVVHEGADHGYALVDRNLYVKEAAERDWGHIFAMFHRQIPPVFSQLA